MLTPSRRTLVQALTVSLLLHVALLSSTVGLSPMRFEVAAARINAVLSERSAAAPVRGASPARSPSEFARAPLPETPGGAARQLAAAPVDDAAAKAPADAPIRPATIENSQSTPTSSGLVGRAAGLAASGPAPSPSSAASVALGAAPGAGQDGVSADDLRQYRLSLATAARRFKQYPALARQRGWEGTVEVVLSVSTQRAVPDVALVRTSGRRVLDEQALDMLAQAARVTTLPEGLKARDFRVLLPVQFSLESDQ